jgi:hypothetical protein
MTFILERISDTESGELTDFSANGQEVSFIW